MRRLQFSGKNEKNLLAMLLVYLLYCHSALAQQLATEEDFPETEYLTSADGRYSAIIEYQYDPLNESEGLQASLYWRDSNTDTTFLVFTGSALVDAIISANGKFIAYRVSELAGPETYRLNLYLHDVDNRETILASADGTDLEYPTLNTTNTWGVNIGSDGRYLTYVRGVGTRSILYLYDSLAGNLDSIVNDESCATGQVAEPDLSSDDKYIAYVYSCGEPALFLYDINNGTHTQLDTGDVPVWRAGPFISENNRYIKFNAPGDVPGQIYDREVDDVYAFGVSAECVDSDGDGWGFNEYREESCLVNPITQSVCDYSNAELNGGWGWNATTSQSCAPLESSVNTPAITPCIDSDGDGYGWDGTATCLIDTGGPDTSTGTDAGCDFSDADLNGGWGWNAVARQSCAPRAM